MTDPSEAKPPPVTQRRFSVPKDSFRTLFLELVFSPKGPDTKPTDVPLHLLATGTGFFYQVGDKLFILTARHNFTGKHWETNEFLSTAYQVEPTHIITLRQTPHSGSYSTPAGSNRMAVPMHSYLLPLIDETWKPIWLQHPEYGAGMDVAALPFPIVADHPVQVLSWDDAVVMTPDPAISSLWVTQDLSIPGYPFGLASGPGMPIWIRGSVASDPNFMYEHNGTAIPAFLVDARTRKGQSGSPVLLFLLPNTPVPTDDGQFRYSTNAHSKLMGVYTGRVSEESDLGFVWQISEARKVCTGGVRPSTGPSAIVTHTD